MTNKLPFNSLQIQALSDLAAGWCVSIFGLSNSGKSTLMRSLASDEAVKLYTKSGNRKAMMVYIDCNRAVALSAQAFYEVVLRSLLEHLDDHIKPEHMEPLRGYYQAVTEAASGFSASLAFNLALTEVCEQFGTDVCLLLDEFDELYTALDDRALLNLRALRDRFRDRLRYATATVRRLPELRGREVEGEFAELFAHSVFPMPLLSESDVQDLFERLALQELDQKNKRLSGQLAGGHPGLLVAVARVVSRSAGLKRSQVESAVGQDPGPRAECMKIWNQLRADEQEALKTLVTESGDGLPARRMQVLEELGLVQDGAPFSPLFAAFVARIYQGTLADAQGVRLDLDSGDVWVDGIRVPVLTDLEFRLLKLLFERRDKLTDKYRIVEGVWGEDYLGEVDDARVEKLVSRLRSKIERDPTEPIYLITQRGRGYKMLSRPRGG